MTEPDFPTADQLEAMLDEHDHARRLDRGGRADEIALALGDLGFRSPEHARENLEALREAERRRAAE
jgi:hypothetical protein